MTNPYNFTHNSMESGVAICDTDITDENLEHLKYAVDNIVTLPSQTGHNGGILTTDGSDASWAETGEIYPVIETYVSGKSWYRIYSDGWCEQGGNYTTGSGAKSVALLKNFQDTEYIISFELFYDTASATSGQYNLTGTNKAVSSFTFGTNYAYGGKWKAEGYLAEGQY